MAYVNFYLTPGGTGAADINAGNSNGAAQATTTNGNWNAATGVFIAASGTPFASTTTADYASVYVDGSTVAVFIGAVTAVTSSTQITVDVATIKYGTAPTTNATARSCTINGQWATEQVLAAGGLASTTIPQATKVNIKGTLTLTTNRTISMAGATTTPLWFSCYVTAPGDADNDTTGNAIATWTVNASFQLQFTGAYQVWSGLSIVGNRSGTVVNATGTNGQLIRCRVENTSANASAIAYTNGTSPWYHACCWFKSPTTLTSNGVVTAGVTGSVYMGCIAEGGGLAGWNVGTGALNCAYCVGYLNTGAAFLASTGSLRLVNCTAYAPSADGAKWSGTPANSSCVIGLLVAGLNGGTATTNGINNASGTNSANVFRACNDYYNVTNPEVGFGDSFAFFPQTDSAFPLTSSTDMTPLTTANAYKHGFPSVFEGGGALGAQVNGGLSIGAVQPTPSASGSSIGAQIFGG